MSAEIDLKSSKFAVRVVVGAGDILGINNFWLGIMLVSYILSDTVIDADAVK